MSNLPEYLAAGIDLPTAMLLDDDNQPEPEPQAPQSVWPFAVALPPLSLYFCSSFPTTGFYRPLAGFVKHCILSRKFRGKQLRICLTCGPCWKRSRQLLANSRELLSSIEGRHGSDSDQTGGAETMRADDGPMPE